MRLCCDCAVTVLQVGSQMPWRSHASYRLDWQLLTIIPRPRWLQGWALLGELDKYAVCHLLLFFGFFGGGLPVFIRLGRESARLTSRLFFCVRFLTRNLIFHNNAMSAL